LNVDSFFMSSAIIDNAHGFAYFGAQSYIVKLQLSSFTEISTTFVSNLNAFLTSAAIDTAAGTAYFGTLEPFAS